jgi:DNA-binding NarL/FixJ family response regulator
MCSFPIWTASRLPPRCQTGPACSTGSLKTPRGVRRRHPNAPDPHHRGARHGKTAPRSHPGIGVLVLSGHLEPDFALALIEERAQGAGYLLKERVADLSEFTDAVRRVARGGLVIDPLVVAQLVGRRRTRNPLDTLTDREREVLSMMAQGRSNLAICDQLHLSPKTVEAYVRAVFTKLGLHQGADDNRRVLAVLAFLRG